MQIQSSAGEFDFEVTDLESDGNTLVLIGQMGAWEARTYISESDMTTIIGLAVRSHAFWRLVPCLPLLFAKAIFSKPKSETTETNNE